MTRFDEDTLSLYLEVALAGAAPTMLDGLTHPDRFRRGAAAADVARHLAERLRCFDIRCEESRIRGTNQSSLFPEDLGPIG